MAKIENLIIQKGIKARFIDSKVFRVTKHTLKLIRKQ